ncbi:transport protein particle component [Thelephora terrestris]|uniref:Transport protein particle component n=1 Tax=Thelephora terrestris TaxID=56493 RepID=A0A9P6H791_9AGAM|nr:transport protein particle component [Thelephora terrestris]
MADAQMRYMDGPAFDFFLIEMVNTLRASSAHAQARARKVEQEMIDAGLLPAPLPTPGMHKHHKDSTASLASRATAKVEDEEEGLKLRLEAIGMHVGANIAEKLCHGKPYFSETLDSIKFVCKDLWAACWDKQVDNLRTNHRGVYVLQDNSFKPIARLSSWEGRQDATKRARVYVMMSAGIVRGALSRLGLIGVVVPEISNLPQCTFQIKLPKPS